jgi:hypothetical protein
MSPGCWLRNGLELDHLRSGKCDAQHLGPEVHEHCRIAVLGADHGTEAVPIMADSIAHGVARHYSDGWQLVEGTSWEGPRGAGAARSHASSVRPLGRAGAAHCPKSMRGRPVPLWVRGLPHFDQMTVGIADVATDLVLVAFRRRQELSTPGAPIGVHGLDVFDPDIELDSAT